jgi:hypothetical protein
VTAITPTMTTNGRSVKQYGRRSVVEGVWLWLLLIGLLVPAQSVLAIPVGKGGARTDVVEDVSFRGGLVVGIPMSVQSAAARDYFARGLKELHVSRYQDAHAAFALAAAEAERNGELFALAYWGLAMSSLRPLAEQRAADVSAARAHLLDLARKAETTLLVRMSARERAYLRAAQAWVDGETVAERRQGAVLAQRRLYQSYPRDAEAAALYGLAVLAQGPGTELTDGPRLAGPDFAAARRVLEGAVASYQHLGALYYLVRLFDHPEWASLAVPYVDQLVQQAPGVLNLRRLAARIWLQLGNWDELERSAAAGFYHVSGGTDLVCLEYLQIAWLQQGRFALARQALDIVAAARAGRPGARAAAGAWARMTARLSIEAGAGEAGSHEADARIPVPSASRLGPAAAAQYGARLLAAGLGAAQRGDRAAVRAVASDFARLQERLAREASTTKGQRAPAGAGGVVRVVAVMALEVQGVKLIERGRISRGLAVLRRAVELDSVIDPAHRLVAVKPAAELLGEVLVKHERYAEAREQFEHVLHRLPNRTASLLGLARAAAGLDEAEAAAHWRAQVADNYRRADPGRFRALERTAQRDAQSR